MKVQIQHPISKRWKLIDKASGQIIGSSEKKYKGVPVAGRSKEKLSEHPFIKMFVDPWLEWQKKNRQ